MSNKKTVSINAFHILKSIMNAKEKKLQATVRTGEAAEQERPIMRNHIAHLQNYIIANQYDPAEAREAEKIMVAYEEDLKAINHKIERAGAARMQLQYVHKFNEIYQAACIKANESQAVRNLKAEQDEIEARMEFVSKRIEACEINMTTAGYSNSVAEQAHRAIDGYIAEYEQLTAHLNDVKASLRRYKTM